MDFITDLQQKWNIDLAIVAIVILSGFFQERFLFVWKVAKDSRLNAALKTLIVSVLASSLYIFFAYKQSMAVQEDARVLIPWGKYFVSYFAATSLYDLIIRPIRRWIAKKTGEPTPPETTAGN